MLVVSNQVPGALFPFADPTTLGRSAIAGAGTLGHGTPTESRAAAVAGPGSPCDAALFHTYIELCSALRYSYGLV